MTQNLMQLTGVDLVVPTHGFEGAKAYPLGLNCRVPLFDDSEDIFYIKATDENGFPSVRAFRYSEIVTETESKNITLNDIRNIIKEELANAQQPISTTDSEQDKPNESSDSTVVKRHGRTKSNNALANTEQQGQGNSVVELS